MNIEYIECDCGTVEHTLRFVWDKSPEWSEIYVEIYLSQHGFFKRVWYSIKYIFGFKSRYGAFEESILSYRGIEQLRNLCSRYLVSHQTHKDAPLKLQLMAHKITKKKIEEEIIEHSKKIEEIENIIKDNNQDK